MQGVKKSKSKAPVFTFCKQMKDAIEAMSYRTAYGHEKYKDTDQDYRNFARVANADYEYSNAMFRHSLGIGGEDWEDETDHIVAAAWDAVARLQCHLENKDKNVVLNYEITK